MRIRLADCRPTTGRLAHRSPMRAVTAAGAALLLMISSACATPAGGSGAGTEAGKPAGLILTDAQTAALAADSVHITGTVARRSSTATVDLVLTSSGDGREQITGAGQAIDLIKVGQTVYVKGLTAPGASAGYQQLSVQDPRAAPLVAQLDKKAVFAQLIKSGDTAAVTGTATIAGQNAITITPAGGVGVLYVADDSAHPYPLEVRTTPAAAASGAPQPTVAAVAPVGALMFTAWNDHAVIHAPQ